METRTPARRALTALLLPLAALPALPALSPSAAPPGGTAAVGGGRAARSAVPTSVPKPVFGPAVDYELSGSEPRDMDVADFDGDGNLDLVVCGSGGPDLSVLFGDGQGGFPGAEDTNVVLGLYDPGPWGLAPGDFDGDGLPDVAVALGSQYDGLGQPNRKVNVFLNDGNRKFDYSVTLQATGTFPIDCTAGDYDGDGSTDLAVVCNTAGVNVFPGLGDGTFGPVRLLASQQNCLRCYTVDLDGDGLLDLVATSSGTFPYQYVYWNDGTGWAAGGATAQGLNPGYGFAWADLDGDGNLDVLASAPDKFPNYTGGLWVRMGLGNRAFSAAQRYGTAFTGALATGDVNGDGRPDVLGLDGTWNASVRVYLGLGNGSFVQDQNLATASDPVDLVLGDWNGDGLGDVASPWRNLGDTPYMTVRLNTTP